MQDHDSEPQNGPKNRRSKKTEAEVASFAESYQDWLLACSMYRAELERLKHNYLTALEAYSELKKPGAPKRK